MKIKLVKRYLLLALPFICGLFLYGIGSYDIVSSLLFFCGGYLLIKNVFDYRMVRKNFIKCIDNDKRMDIASDDRKIDNEVFLEIDRDMVDNDIIDDLENNDEIYMVDKDKSRNRYSYKYRRTDNIPGLKNTRRYIKIRRRY